MAKFLFISEMAIVSKVSVSMDYQREKAPTRQKITNMKESLGQVLNTALAF